MNLDEAAFLRDEDERERQERYAYREELGPALDVPFEEAKYGVGPDEGKVDDTFYEEGETQ